MQCRLDHGLVHGQPAVALIPHPTLRTCLRLYMPLRRGGSVACGRPGCPRPACGRPACGRLACGCGWNVGACVMACGSGRNAACCCVWRGGLTKAPLADSTSTPGVLGWDGCRGGTKGVCGCWVGSGCVGITTGWAGSTGCWKLGSVPGCVAVEGCHGVGVGITVSWTEGTGLGEGLGTHSGGGGGGGGGGESRFTGDMKSSGEGEVDTGSSGSGEGEGDSGKGGGLGGGGRGGGAGGAAEEGRRRAAGTRWSGCWHGMPLCSHLALQLQ